MISPSAFIWVHAQTEKDVSKIREVAQTGAWISFDGISDTSIEEYKELIFSLRDADLIQKVLISHDAGWYSPGEINGGEFRGYTALFDHLVPVLHRSGMTVTETDSLLIDHPAKAFTIGIKKL
jgi:phosphotriesterase-related protein